jgi:PHP family Zn ribbon phosphoesterase
VTGIRVDLHIHTLLSPCAEDEMTPRNIVGRAIYQELDAIAITDHNSTGNVRSVIEAAKGTRLLVIPGVEIQTQEEVHIVGLFKNVSAAEAFGLELRNYLPDVKNRKDYFGSQIIVDVDGKSIGEEERMLLNSTRLQVEDAFFLIGEFGGVGICAHVDRSSYSIVGQLGFIPPELSVGAVEVSYRLSTAEALEKFPFLSKYPVICSSDAHRLSDIGKGFTVLCPEHKFWHIFNEFWKGT